MWPDIMSPEEFRNCSAAEIKCGKHLIFISVPHNIQGADSSVAIDPIAIIL